MIARCREGPRHLGGAEAHDVGLVREERVERREGGEREDHGGRGVEVRRGGGWTVACTQKMMREAPEKFSVGRP